jgi:cell division protein SepF
MQPDSFWAKIVRASRAGPPLFKLTASPWWLEVLVAAGARRGAADDSMAVKFRKRELERAARHQIRDSHTVVRPRHYEEARRIGELFRSGEPVIMDLRGMIDHDARRLVDFAAGLIFGLRGSIDKIDSKLFILLPNGMELRTFIDNTGKGYGLVIVTTEQGQHSVPRSGRDKVGDGSDVDDSGDLLDLLHAVS